jgi:hypothetical protein
MLKINKLYRRGYTGEEIIAQRTLQDGNWTTVTEHVPNNVTNNQISNRAVVFGNGESRLTFNTKHVMDHKSGLLGADTLQTYACNAFYRDYTPDFLVVTDRRIASEIVDKKYTDNNIVYTRVDVTLEFPKKFYLIPHDVYADAGTTALYLAAFDGHQRIYMLGFDGQDTPGHNNNVYANTAGYDPVKFNVSDEKWINNQLTVFNTYNDVDFVHVSETGRATIPEAWKYCTNLRRISYRDMVLEADL